MPMKACGWSTTPSLPLSSTEFAGGTLSSTAFAPACGAPTASPDGLDVETELKHAIATARACEARCSSCARRLWADLGERRKAYDLLAPIYGWFTEGFDTADLKDAKALLDELA